MNVKSLLIKFVLTTVVLLIILGIFYGVSFSDILVTGIAVTIIGYVVDIYLLPKMGILFAAITDFAIVMLLLYLFDISLFEETITIGAIFLCGFLIGIGELRFHQYLERIEYKNQFAMTELNRGYYRKSNLQTEFGSEIDIENIEKKATDFEG